MKFKSILLGLDGSEHSLKALEYTKELAEVFSSKLVIVHAYRRTSNMHDSEGYDRLVSQRKNAGRKILKKAKDYLKNTTIEVEEDLLEGPAAEAILSVAETRKVNLIVLGTRGMGTFQELLLGSVSNNVTHHATCPVLVVR